jgi:hypothetical protein
MGNVNFLVTKRLKRMMVIRAIPSMAMKDSFKSKWYMRRILKLTMTVGRVANKMEKIIHFDVRLFPNLLFMTPFPLLKNGITLIEGSSNLYRP